MLVLSRKRGQRVIMNVNGDLITIEILRMSTGRVRIGIKAPNKIMVYRQELWEKVASQLFGNEIPDSRPSISLPTV